MEQAGKMTVSSQSTVPFLPWTVAGNSTLQGKQVSCPPLISVYVSSCSRYLRLGTEPYPSARGKYWDFAFLDKSNYKVGDSVIEPFFFFKFHVYMQPFRLWQTWSVFYIHDLARLLPLIYPFLLYLFFKFFFHHVLCLYTTLWVMTDLSAATYNNQARLGAPYLLISALSRRV